MLEKAWAAGQAHRGHNKSFHTAMWFHRDCLPITRLCYGLLEKSFTMSIMLKISALSSPFNMSSCLDRHGSCQVRLLRSTTNLGFDGASTGHGSPNGTFFHSVLFCSRRRFLMAGQVLPPSYRGLVVILKGIFRP